MTSQTWHTIRARTFIDCSGDSILAAVTGAEFRAGREARAEFNEDIEPLEGRRQDDGQHAADPVAPHRWRAAIHRASMGLQIRGPAGLPHRINGVQAHNFWWLEIGGLQDTIKDAETIRDELMRIGYGVWDYIKNRAPERDQAADWALEWIGSLPGKRENRRYVGRPCPHPE